METSGVGAGKAKRKIEIEIALSDIRSGLDDVSLMEKYRVSARGLQSLFDKLVRAGAIELEELDRRMPAFMGTVFVFEEGPTGDRPSLSTGTGSSIDLDMVLRDIREGMEDSDLMAEYQLSAQGLESLFVHLVYSGLITRMELDLRMPSVDSTVDLRGLVGRLARKEDSDASVDHRGPDREDPDGCAVDKDGQEECVDCKETASRFADRLWPQG